MEKELADFHKLTRQHLEEQQLGQKCDIKSEIWSCSTIPLQRWVKPRSYIPCGLAHSSSLKYQPLIKISSLKKDWVFHHDRLKPFHAVEVPLWVQCKQHTLLSPSSKEQIVPQGKMSKESEHLQDEPVFCTCLILSVIYVVNVILPQAAAGVQEAVQAATSQRERSRSPPRRIAPTSLPEMPKLDLLRLHQWLLQVRPAMQQLGSMDGN
jgi:hypothetical protein